MTTINQQLTELHANRAEDFFNDWERGFIVNVYATSRQANRPDLLSGPQVEKIESLYKKLERLSE